MAELWIPGYAGPLDDLVERIHRRIEQFASEAGVEQACVEVELADGSRYASSRSAPSPATASSRCGRTRPTNVPQEVIVPVGSIKRIELSKAAEERGRLGFSLPPSAAEPSRP